MAAAICRGPRLGAARQPGFSDGKTKQAGEEKGVGEGQGEAGEVTDRRR